MNILKTASLARGAMIADMAFSDGGRTLSIEVPEYVGLVAACLNRGLDPIDMKRELSKRISSSVATRAKQTFEYFSHWHGESIWSQGPASDDVRLHNRKLIVMFPEVNAINERLFESLS